MLSESAEIARYKIAERIEARERDDRTRPRHSRASRRHRLATVLHRLADRVEAPARRQRPSLSMTSR